MPAKKKSSSGPQGNHKSEVRASLISITPELASRWVEKNYNNRKLDFKRVARLAKEMVAGRWQTNGDTIKFTGEIGESELLDGQHRLWAIIEAEMTIEILVAEFVPQSAMTTIDIGRKRGLSDIAAIAGYHNAASFASAAVWLHWYLSGSKRESESIERPSHSVMLEFIDKELPDLAAACTVVGRHKHARLLVAPAVLSGVYCIAARTQPQKSLEWLTLLDTGEGLEEKHPILQLRQRLLLVKSSRRRMRQKEMSAFTIKSYNAFLTGKYPGVLRWKFNEAFPTIEV